MSYTENLNEYIEDVKSYARVLETEYLDVIVKNKQDKTSQCNPDSEDFPSYQMSYEEFRELKDMWYHTKSHNFQLLEQVCDNMRLCTDYIGYSNHEESDRVSTKIHNIINNIL